jgi:UDP-N-acetylglucosamine/UDP-N-acetylgalactosamine diphosphorylase
MDFESAKKQLAAYGQEHVLKDYDTLDAQGQEALLKQIESIDFSVLDLLKDRDSELKKGVITPLPGTVTVDEIAKKKDAFYETGIKALQSYKVGAVLLAGGQGTRLGADGPKGVYNIGVTKEVSIFERLIANLMDVVKQAGVWVPLMIMTSDKNDTETRAFFEKKNYFGYNKEFVRFFIQDMAPSVDYNGKIYMEGKDRISMSPNGNGGWFSSLVRAGVLDWAKEFGVEWLNIFAVDNVLQRIADPCFVGATLQTGYACGAKVVRKAAPDEKVGVMCKEDGRPSIVEYYELTDAMMDEKDENGDLVYNFGVILNYLFRVTDLEHILNQRMPLHIVEKKIPYMDEAGNFIKPETPNGYKFETLVLDMIKMLDDCVAYEVVRNREFAPVKNKTGVDSVESARALLAENGVEL